MPAITSGWRSAPVVPLRRHRRQASPLPDKGEQRDRCEAEERAAPADHHAEPAAERGGDNRGQRIAAVENRQRAGYLMTRHQPNRRCRAERPEPADRHANQRAARHIGEVIGRERDDDAGQRHQQRQPQQQGLAVEIASEP